MYKKRYNTTLNNLSGNSMSIDIDGDGNNDSVKIKKLINKATEGFK